MGQSVLQQAELFSQPLFVPGKSVRQAVRAFATEYTVSACAGAVKDWPAVLRWRGQAGVHRMAELAGQAQVQAMISTDQDSLFFGNMRQHSPQTCSFADFLSAEACGRTDGAYPNPPGTPESPQHAYLAQASLDSGQPLAPLRQDFDIPEVIKHAELTHTNLWMSIRY